MSSHPDDLDDVLVDWSFEILDLSVMDEIWSAVFDSLPRNLRSGLIDAISDTKDEELPGHVIAARNRLRAVEPGRKTYVNIEVHLGDKKVSEAFRTFTPYSISAIASDHEGVPWIRMHAVAVVHSHDNGSWGHLTLDAAELIPVAVELSRRGLADSVLWHVSLHR